MKHTRNDRSIVAGCLAAWIASGAFSIVHAQAPASSGPLLRLDHLSRLTAESKNPVDLTLDQGMLQAMAGLVSQQAAADPGVKELLAGLKTVVVKSFEFDRDGVYTAADIDAIRSQLGGPWRRYTALQGQGQSIDVYGWHEGEMPGGLVVVVGEPRRLTVVNVVGVIDLAKITALAGQFGIPNLPLPGAPPPR